MRDDEPKGEDVLINLGPGPQTGTYVPPPGDDDDMTCDFHKYAIDCLREPQFCEPKS
jgi:hypothetical protein